MEDKNQINSHKTQILSNSDIFNILRDDSSDQNYINFRFSKSKKKTKSKGRNLNKEPSNESDLINS